MNYEFDVPDGVEVVTDSCDEVKASYRGLWIKITLNRDDDMGPPWEEHDGHGPVSEWTSRDKRPGERVLSSHWHGDNPSRRYYDVEEATEIAKRDGWGIHPDSVDDYDSLTRGQIVAKAVENDFKFLKGWCNDEWYWIWYGLVVEDEDGEEIHESSLGGIDDWGYAVEEALSEAVSEIDSHLEEVETQKHAAWVKEVTDELQYSYVSY